MKQKKRNLYIVSIFLMLTVVVSAMTGCSQSKRVTQETNDTTYGIDVARYQGTINWQEIAQSDVDFAIIRVGFRGLSDGEISEDSNGRYNLQEATKAGIRVGAYFFSTAITEEEAVEEATWLARIIDGYPITYPVVYDCEGFNDPDSRQFFMTKKERTDVALAFLETIGKLGYEGMFYASKGDLEFENHWDTSRIEEKYKIWVAQYPAEPFPKTAKSSYDGMHHMWQYATNGEIPGINQPVDLNIAYFGYDGIEPAKAKEVPSEVEPDVEALMDFKAVSEQVTAKEETNLRSIPSQDIDSIVLRTLKNGDVAERIAVSSSGWSKLVYDGEVYYAVSSYLTTDIKYGYDTEIKISAEANAEDIQTQFYERNEQVTAKDTVNLRSLPSVKHEDCVIIAQLKNGDEATCVGISDNGWSKLIYRGTTCYAVSSYLTPVETVSVIPEFEEQDVDLDFSSINEIVTAKEKVNLRTVPNTDASLSEVIGQMQPGDTATRIGISSNGWSKLIYDGTTCYAVSRYLTALESMPVGEEGNSSHIQTKFEARNDRVTAKVEVNLRTLPSVEDPECVIAAKLKNGEVITRTGINKELGWSRVEYNGKTLYCITSYLKDAG